MGTHGKFLQRILEGRSDANIDFSELCALLLHLGLVERTKGSHHIFRSPDVEERINLQREGNKAKPYQVRQVRTIILRYRLGGNTDV
jgi:predicted RNA binding protein YcfA (HicA-like mRNA interferase family)